MIFFLPHSILPNDSHEYDPFNDPTIKRIGNATYTVNIRCRGAEPFWGKIKRLLFDDPLSPKERLPYDISEEL